jgi:hypothetical protein
MKMILSQLQNDKLSIIVDKVLYIRAAYDFDTSLSTVIQVSCSQDSKNDKHFPEVNILREVLPTKNGEIYNTGFDTEEVLHFKNYSYTK